ncbi:transglycosylase SLT domain-containing protein [Acaryochloris sp. CCMEE 5410]|uniref:lytic transglycosylase domain-containing protein n=1 Tax=Acaryochloris sp. CCMEE 5410 TaxID=310037 RepID=UPI0002483A74|nr:transglycosylase SLT domain-containing protein [Acaryochloris sp. CCMEE 5410]KAI9133665.1 transglycosylase SLT domain-containing protein [Acaryochloris sp. CCMEE 5410]
MGSSPNFLKRLAPWIISMGLSSALVLGLAWLFLKPKLESTDQPLPSPQVSTVNSALVALRPLPAQQRIEPLKQLAQQGTAQEQNQARYVLTADLINLGQGAEALQWLEGLEARYPLLGSHIAVLQAEAQTLAGQTEQATKTWQRIIADYPQEPAAAEALFVLGQQQPELWQQAIADFPAHPNTVKIAVEQLKKKPKQLPLLMLIAEHGLFLTNYGDYLTQLTKEFKGQLKPADWQIIAFGYWEKQLYKEGALAYAQAPQTAQTAYRGARGLQLGGEKKKAIAAYQKMIAAYPQAKETPLALSKLASLEKDLSKAAQHYDRAFQLSQDQQPTLAAQILGERIQRLEKAKQPSSTFEKTLLQQFSASNDAAALRWQQAERQRKAGDLAGARKLALDIQAQNPNSPQAATAVFWAGKWASTAEDRQAAFQTLWQTYPDSYYAWRAAVLSGWNVGDFTSIRSFQPQIRFPSTQLPLATGSPALKELYQLGQSKTAWARWQWEFRNRQQPSLSEQLTDGLLRLGVQEYLDGIYMLANLETRAREENDPEKLVEKWQDHLGFEQALFPLAYFTPIRKWSNQRNLNPLLVLSLMRQESRFQPKIRSVAGAVGLMQVLPETAEWVSEKAGLKDYQIDGIDDNINLGTWYLDYTHRNYNDNSMLAIASYNAGPGNVDRWVKQTSVTDVDVFVEEIPFPETKNYVKSVSENYWNYLRLYNPQIQQLMREQAQ